MEAFISQTKVSYEFPSEIVYEHKFDTAIRDTFATKFEERTKANNYNMLDKAMLSQLAQLNLPREWNKDVTYMGRTTKGLLASTYRMSDSAQARVQYQKLTHSVQLIYEIQWSNMLKNFHVTNKATLGHKLHNRLATICFPREVQALLEYARWLSQVIDKSARLRRRQGKMSNDDYFKRLKSNNHFKFDPLNVQIIVGDNISLYIMNQTIWMIPNSAILMLHNKACDQVSVLLFAWLSQGVSLPDNAYTLTVEFVQELAALNIRYKQKYFDIAKALESLCIAETIKYHEDWPNAEFLNVTSADLLESSGFEYQGSYLQMLITSTNTPMKHELCCLGKIIGHPYVNMKEGAKSLYDKTHEIYQLNFLAIQKCIGHIKANYIRNHIMRHGKWPPCTLSFGGPMTLTQAYVRGRDPFDKHLTSQYGPVTIDDMVYVELEQNDKFQKLENVIPYLKDKTITLLRSKVMKELLGDHTSTEKPKWEETRLILAYLLHPKVLHDHVAYIDRYEDSNDLEELLDYLVIRIVPKEKELKTQFRGFGCKTYEDRFRALAQEKTAMRYLDNYSDEQAMTLNELEILRRLSTYRSISRAYPGFKILYVNIDASSWNNHFRSETVDFPMQHTLDPIFGTRIFQKTHMAFEKTLFYIPGYPDTYHWVGQGGGIEGLNQDTWVIVYIGQIKTALDGLNVKYYMLVKGDDLRIIIAIPPSVWKNRPMSDIKNDIVARLSRTMTEFGHKIKILESYGSGKYLAFSKSASIENIELPQGFRKIQKCYGSNNALIATLDEYIGSGFSNAHSTCKVETCVSPAYLVGCMWALIYLATHPRYASCTANEYAALLLTPSLAGGFPIIYLHNMPIRAESDLLSPFIEIYSHCIRYYPAVGILMANMMQAPYYVPGTKMTMLYKDPYAIPSNRPELPAAMLRKMIVPILKRYVKQEDVKELLDACSSEDMELFHQCFESVNVFNAKIMSALHGATPEGILSELVRKFESARSINELMIRTLGSMRSTRLLRKVVRAEAKVQKWRIEQLRGQHTPGPCSYADYISACPAESADRIRKILWGREITGITMPPLQHQIMFLPAFTHIDNDWVNNNHFTYSISERENSIDNHHTDHYASGPYKPFIGYTTRNGMTEPSVHFIDKDPMLTKVKNLLDLVTWTNTSKLLAEGILLESNCDVVIKAILKTITDTPLDTLAPFSGTRRSGTIQHHVRAPSFRESIVPNTTSNVYTRVLGESNSHIRYRNSPHHYYVNFLHIYCYSIWASFWELEFSPYTTIPEKIWAVTTNCEFCNRPIEEIPLRFNIAPIRGMSLHPLAVSSLGQVAEQILRESVAALDAKRVNPDRRAVQDLPLEIAQTGILQEILEQTYYARKRLMTRYDIPVMTDDAYSVLVDLMPKSRGRDVGQSEIKRIPVEELGLYLAGLIVKYTDLLLPKKVTDTQEALLSAIPGEDLPWFGILSQVHKAGKLPQLILYFSKTLRTAFPLCYYNPVVAARYLGRCAPYLSRTMRYTRPLIILSYYNNSQVSSAVSRVLYVGIIQFLRKYLDPYVPKHPLNRDNMTDGQWSDICLIFHQLLIFLTVIYHINTIADDLSERIIGNNSLVLRGLGVEELTEVLVDDFLQDEGPYVLVIQRHLKNWEERGITFDSVGEPDSWEDILLQCIQLTHNIEHDIHYTNIGHCCLKVRSSEPTQDTDTDDLPEKEIIQAPDDPERVMALQLNRPCVTFVGQDHIDALYAEEDPHLILTTNERHIPYHHLFDILGGGAGSETTLLYILDGIGKTYTITNDPVSAACLADGYGGFSHVIAQMFPRSIIIYHTLIEDPHSDTVPVSLLNSQAQYTVLTDHLREGHDQLHVASTFIRLKQYQRLHDIITSDLELGDDQAHLNDAVQYNLLKYYLETRTRECLVILKTRTLDYNTLEKMINVLMHFCSTCAIHSPRNNNSYRYVYVVARGWRKSYDMDMLSNIWNGTRNPHARNGVLRYYKQVKSQARKVANLMNVGLDIWTLDPGFHTKNYDTYWLLEYRMFSLLQGIFNTTMILAQSDDLPGSTSWDSSLSNLFVQPTGVNCDKILGLHMSKYIVKLYLLLKTPEAQELGSRRHHLLCQIFTAVACKGIMELFTGRDDPLVLTWEIIDDLYTTAVNYLERRDIRGIKENTSWMDEDWEHEGTWIRYNSSFRRGLVAGYVFLGSISIFRQTHIKAVGRAAVQANE